jgi:hypothetical protein
MKKVTVVLALLAVFGLIGSWALTAGAQEPRQVPGKPNVQPQQPPPGAFQPMPPVQDPRPPAALERRPGTPMAPMPQLQGGPPPVVVANEKYVYVLIGPKLHQYSADSLKLLNTADLPRPAGPNRPNDDAEDGR